MSSPVQQVQEKPGEQPQMAADTLVRAVLESLGIPARDAELLHHVQMALRQPLITPDGHQLVVVSFHCTLQVPK